MRQTPRFLSLVIICAGFIGPAQALTLSEAMVLALSHDPTYLAATRARDAGLEKKVQGLASLLPTITATGSDGKIERDGVVGKIDSSGYVVRLSQPILNLAAIRVAQQGREATVASEAIFHNSKQDALLRVSSAYFEVLNAEATLATAQSEKKAIGEQLESAKRSFEVGTATVTDQQEAQARFDLIVALEIRAQNTLNIRRQALSLIVGQPVPQRLPAPHANPQIPTPSPKDPDDWVAQARTANFAVLRALAEQEQARLQVSRQFAAHLPTIDLIVSRNRNEESTLGGGSTLTVSNFVGVNVTVPLLNGGATISLVREARASYEESSHKLDAAKLVAEQSAREAYLNVLAGLAQISALQAAERSSRLALESNRLGYEVGVRINIDVLNAQQQLFAAQRDLAKARNDTLLASLQLRAAVGGLQPADVEAVSQVINAR